MELILKNKHQHMIADLLWDATSLEQVDAIINTFGQDAIMVRHLMIAAYLDEINTTDLAEEVINRVR